jgi:hypothetical protein
VAFTGLSKDDAGDIYYGILNDGTGSISDINLSIGWYNVETNKHCGESDVIATFSPPLKPNETRKVIGNGVSGCSGTIKEGVEIIYANYTDGALLELRRDLDSGTLYSVVTRR